MNLRLPRPGPVRCRDAGSARRPTAFTTGREGRPAAAPPWCRAAAVLVALACPLVPSLAATAAGPQARADGPATAPPGAAASAVAPISASAPAPPRAAAAPRAASRPAVQASAPGRLDRGVRPLHIALEVEPIVPADGVATQFEARATLRFRAEAALPQLELHAVELEIDEAQLDGTPLATPASSADGQRLAWRPPEGSAAIAPGEHVLTLRYRGRIGQAAEGLYRIDSPSPQGTRHVLATQMEPTGARRLLPLWDEPAFRVPFEVSAVLPEPLQVVSNGALRQREALPPREPGGPTRQRWRFETTPAMPSYLLALFAGPFDSLNEPADTPRLRVLTMPGRAAEATLALQATRAVLREYVDYFAQPYTLPKLDAVALPGGFGGAMENWGAIAYHEGALLYDRDKTPASRRLGVWSIVAHEVAHQWFGNLVTMAWWDDLWLNEGFATWMAARTTQKLNPADPVWADEAVDIDAAMQDDALPSALPVRRPVRDDREAFASFDDITYQKGMAFVRMLEQWIGPEPFRDGLRRYMAAHAMGNATTADLWRALEAASGRPAAAIAGPWVDRPGLPRIDVESHCLGARLEVSLAQARFETRGSSAPPPRQAAGAPSAARPASGARPALDAPPRRASAAPPSRRAARAPKPLPWPVPLTLGRYDDEGRLVEQRSVLLDTPARREAFDGCHGTVKANVEGAGYYRSRPAAPDAARLTTLFARLPDTERVNLLADRWALAAAGDAPLADWLALVDQLGSESSPPVWRQAYEGLARLDGLLYEQASAADLVAWRARVAAIAAPRLDALGLQPHEGEREGDARVRDLLLRLLGRFDHAPTVRAVQRLWEQKLPDPDATLDAVPASMRRGVLALVGRHADRETMAQLWRLAAEEPDAAWRSQLWQSIAGVRDPALARVVATMTLGDDAPAEESAWLLAGLADAGHRRLAWQTLASNFDAVTRRTGEWQRGLVAPAVLAGASDPRLADELLAWTRERIGPWALAPAQRGAETIRVNAGLVRGALDAVQDWAVPR